MPTVAQYDVPLRLTSPHMTGPAVRDAQWLMAGNNPFPGLATYKDGDVDGDYGPLSAQATSRAKYWLGYPNQSCDQTFGQVLYEYLLGRRDLPAPYAATRVQRLAEQATPGSKAIAVARTQIGTEESPFGSNRQKYGSWYRMNGVPWCAIFCSWCFDQSGTKTFRYSYVPTIHSDATLARNKMIVARTPRQGDLACYTVHGTRDAHVAFFDEWENEGSSFWDLGGNTGPTNISNGGAVMRQLRTIAQVNVFVRVA